jgi:hypothetical protein
LATAIAISPRTRDVMATMMNWEACWRCIICSFLITLESVLCSYERETSKIDVFICQFVALLQIAELEIAVRGIVASGHNWTDVCARYALTAALRVTYTCCCMSFV